MGRLLASSSFNDYVNGQRADAGRVGPVMTHEIKSPGQGTSDPNLQVVGNSTRVADSCGTGRQHGVRSSRLWALVT